MVTLKKISLAYKKSESPTSPPSLLEIGVLPFNTREEDSYLYATFTKEDMSKLVKGLNRLCKTEKVKKDEGSSYFDDYFGDDLITLIAYSIDNGTVICIPEDYRKCQKIRISLEALSNQDPLYTQKPGGEMSVREMLYNLAPIINN